ncbi:MAG: hypothetical protein GY708_09200 [Actinomycetia bacterium]|nr:hypothetical protein [Actinomycetes bacterium]
MNADNQTPTRPPLTTPNTSRIRQHVLIVGAALFVIGALTLTLLPDSTAFRLAGSVLAISHLGFLLAVGSLITRWRTRRRAPREC